jgi:hypothetical protein
MDIKKLFEFDREQDIVFKVKDGNYCRLSVWKDKLNAEGQRTYGMTLYGDCDFRGSGHSIVFWSVTIKKNTIFCYGYPINRRVTASIKFTDILTPYTLLT